MASRDPLPTIANLLSLARIPLGGLFWFVLRAPWGGPWLATGVLALAAVTDVLDGAVARWGMARQAARGRSAVSAAPPAPPVTAPPVAAPPVAAPPASPKAPGAPAIGGVFGAPEATPAGTGSWLDPICDKLFVAAVLAAIWAVRRPSFGLLAMIVARELAQLPLSLVYLMVPSLRRWLRYDFRASILGKAATVAQFLAIAALILDHPSIRIFAVIAFVLGVTALVDYVRRAVAIGRSRLGSS